MLFCLFLSYLCLNHYFNRENTFTIEADGARLQNRAARFADTLETSSRKLRIESLTLQKTNWVRLFSVTVEQHGQFAAGAFYLSELHWPIFLEVLVTYLCRMQNSNCLVWLTNLSTFLLVGADRCFAAGFKICSYLKSSHMKIWTFASCYQFHIYLFGRQFCNRVI